jgi:rhodanese-related sulfurtransferase
MNQLSVTELAAWLQDAERPQPILLDVREPWEVQTASIAGATAIPMGQIPQRIDEINTLAAAPDAQIVAICHHGSRSAQVAMFLERQGLGPIHNLAGGIEAWSREVDPSVPRY